MESEKSTSSLLGTFRRRIAGKQYRPHSTREGDAVYLIRDPKNKYDENAIRIENEECDLLGYIPRKEAIWIAPLIDQGRIQVEGRIVTAISDDNQLKTYVEVWVYLLDDSIIQVRPPRSSLDVSHQMVVQAFKQLDDYIDPALVLETKNQLSNAASNVLPETRLLLVLFQSKAKDIRKKNSKVHLSNLEKALSGLELGDEIRNNGFSIIPIYNRDETKKRIILLNQAIQDGLIHVEESSTSGEVQSISVKNLCPDPILIPEGEILIGAKQNRVVNVTLLLTGYSSLKIPVSCVEQGRWRFAGETFFNMASKAPPRLRGKNMKYVKESLKTNQGFEGNQQEVWSEVHYCLASTDTESSTDSLTDSYDKNKENIQQNREKLVRPKDAVGFIFLKEGQSLGMDIYAKAEMLEQAWDKLIDSYISDALYYNKGESAKHPIEPKDMLKYLKESLQPSAKTIGAGQRFELGKSQVEGSCLIDGTDLCHSSAFFVD